MSVHASPKCPTPTPMPMSMPTYASDSTMPIFDISRASTTPLDPTNPPDNLFSNDARRGSANSGLALRLLEIDQYGKSNLSLNPRRCLISQSVAASPRPVLEPEFSTSFEATQSLIRSLWQMRTRGRMHQAPVPGPSGMMPPPSGLVAPRSRPRSMLPIPTFEIAPTVPLPDSPRTELAHTRYQLCGEENAADDASAILTEVNNSADTTYTDFLSYDYEAASISRAQMSYLSSSKFDSLSSNDEDSFAQAYDSSFPGAYGDDSFFSNYDHEGDSYALNPESPVLKPELMEGPPAIREGTAAQSLSSSVTLRLPTEIEAETSAEAKRYDADDESEDD
ncbi:hypothetical protein FRC10_008066 [Ceratobasidium sp. 414]|nr:hypothetical protein FRC10_008066 [Ceratobasidium sp. 414]